MRRSWAAVEKEYGEPITDVINHYREDGNPWHVIAGALDVADSTLCRWRKHLGIPLTDHQHELHSPVERGRRHVDKHARAAGYQGIEDAIYELRVAQGLTWNEVGAKLGLSPHRIQELAPEEVNGEYHMSQACREHKRRWSAEMRARAWQRLRLRHDHPWQQDEDARIDEIVYGR